MSDVVGLDAPAHEKATIYDVFLSHNSRDKPVVERLAERLKRQRLEPWLDKWCLTPGGDWQGELAGGLAASSSCAVFVGPSDVGDWEREELRVALDRAAKDRSFRVFLVLLPGVPDPFDASKLSPFLGMRTWVDLRPGFGGSRAVQALINAIKGIPFGPDVPIEPHPGVCPYRGLQAFDEDHAEFFFGRDAETQRLVEKLKEGSFLAIVGPSGSGKSSLARAGLVPALRHGALPGSDAWRIVALRPGAHPLDALSAHLARLSSHLPVHRIRDDLAADPRTLRLLVSGEERVVWLVDQCEELFTLCGKEEERRLFLLNLLHAGSEGPSVVVLALRADFYHRLAAYPEVAQVVSAHQFLVGPMDTEGLRQAIEEPARRVGLEFETGLVETILEDVVRQPGALPLLEHALLELWERRRGSLLTLEAYQESGGVAGALAQRAEATLGSLSAEQQEVARRVLLRLTQPGEGGEDTRRQATMAELVTGPEAQPAVETVVRGLADARLLTVGARQDADAVVDVSHEALIRAWPRLRGWINEDRETLRAHHRLIETARDWHEAGREEGLLYRGARLAAWRERSHEGLNELEREFLTVSFTAADRERAARRRRVRLAFAGLCAALITISIAAVVVFGQRQAARAYQLAAEARVQLTIDPEKALRLAVRAHQARGTLEAESALRQATLESRVRAILPGHQGEVSSAAFSPDGDRVVSGGADETVLIWDWRGSDPPRRLPGQEGGVNWVNFDRQGRRVVGAGADKTVRVWDLTSGLESPPQLLRGHTDEVRQASFSADGQRVVSAGADGTVRVWDVVTGRESLAQPLRANGGIMHSVAFSPDGQRVVSGGADRMMRLWDLATGHQLLEVEADSEAVVSVAFHPYGTHVVTAGEGDRTAKVWNLADLSHPVMVMAYDSDVSAKAVDFSPDGQQVVIAADDGSVRVWEWAEGKGRRPTTLAVLRGHPTIVYRAAFSPDGQRVVSAGGDGTVRVWELWGSTERLLRGHEKFVESVAYSEDGRRLVSASADGTVRVWDVATGREALPTPLRHEARVLDAALSRDGQRVVSASEDKTVRVWDLATGRELLPKPFRHDEGAVGGVAFSPNGRYVASGGDDKKVWLWDLEHPDDPEVLGEHRDALRAVAFSPDGRYVASGGFDGAVKLWDLSNRHASIDLKGHQARVAAVAFSRDGRYLVSGGDDRIVRVWDWRRRPKPVASLTGHTDRILSVAFSPDGRQVVSSGYDDTARIWDWKRTIPPLVLRADVDAIDVAFNPVDGRQVAIADGHRLVRIEQCDVCGPIDEALDLAGKRVTRQLTPTERASLLRR